MKNKLLLAVLAIPLGVAGILAVVAYAQTGNRPPVQAQQPAIEQKGQDVEVNDQTEGIALQAQATITAEQAKQIAEAKVGGTASSVKLGDENGAVIYEVVVSGQEVRVDAKTGSVLKVEKQGSEAPDNQNEAKGSDKETLDAANGADQEAAD